jgi:hypothetical protein
LYAQANEASSSQASETLFQRRKRLDAGVKTTLSFQQKTGSATLRQVQEELRQGFDSMIVGGTLLPTAIVPQMMKLLKPSSPFVVFSQYAQPLLDVMELLFKVGSTCISS